LPPEARVGIVLGPRARVVPVGVLSKRRRSRRSPDPQRRWQVNNHNHTSHRRRSSQCRMWWLNPSKYRQNPSLNTANGRAHFRRGRWPRTWRIRQTGPSGASSSAPGTSRRSAGRRPGRRSVCSSIRALCSRECVCAPGISKRSWRTTATAWPACWTGTSWQDASTG